MLYKNLTFCCCLIFYFFFKFIMDGIKNYEIHFVYFAEFKNDDDKLIENTMENIEEKDYLKYYWLDKDNIEEYKILPIELKEIIKENKYPTQKIAK